VRQVTGQFRGISTATALRSAPDGPAPAQPGEEGR